MGRSRRDFLRAAGAVMAGAAGASADASADGQHAYAAAVRAEPTLCAFWPLQGSLAAAAGPADLAMRGGEAIWEAGPAGGRALMLAPGRYATAGVVLGLDTERATVELFFRLPDALPTSYNPCLAAARASSARTRFSLHVMRDLRALAVWNAQAVSLFTPHEGSLRPGAWRHLAVTSRPDALRLYLDGVECPPVVGILPFNLAQVGLPFQIGASSPSGEEAFPCLLANIALYAEALTPEAIARHVDAAGWRARREHAARERRRRDEERRREQAEAERARRAKIARRLRDPRLFARGEQRVYRGEHLGAIAFPLGGIGAGTLQMNGRAERFSWQVFNNFLGVALPDSFFAVRAGVEGAQPVVRALQTSRAGAFPAVAGLSFRGEYPFAWYDFEDPDLPVRVGLEAFTPLVPLVERDSAMPCAVFSFTVENRAAAPVEVALLAAQQNAVGQNGRDPTLGRAHRGYGGNRGRIIRDAAGVTLHMTSDRPAGDAAAGDMALRACAPRAEGCASSPAPAALHAAFARGAALSGPQEAGPSAAGETLNGALEVSLRLPPGAKGSVRFVLAWHFPNARHGDPEVGWGHEGNRYGLWWPDALAVAREVGERLDELTAETRLYHDTFYRGNLPRWLLDRVGSQVAILRSKTCFWAADGYFGGWEGCGAGAGCCMGSCDHVWHYAQAHARLFPAIARRMREATFGYQFADGGLPHRHPGAQPALDGQCGEILGAYREHLGSADDAWMRALWPRVKRAIEHTIACWDPDEDGMLAGPQLNTLDGELGGSTTWIGSLYLAALGACERLAKHFGDAEAAARFGRIRRVGAANQDRALWNGEYYVQRRDPTPRQDYGDGCHIDQCLGEWWSRQVGIEAHYPAEHVRSALRALVRHNFRPDFHDVTQVPRRFAADGDAGLQMIQWPRGPRPMPTILYGDEVMTGFEYAAAATMVQYGLLREGLMVALAVSDRYDGRLRTGLTPGDTSSWGYSGNPFGDDECGKFYARAMSVWSLLLACQGFTHDGPAGIIGFRPRWRPEDHASFFVAAEGWGLFTQRRSGGVQRSRVELVRGRLRLRRLLLETPRARRPAGVRVALDGAPVPARPAEESGGLAVDLDEVTLRAGQALDVTLE
ncbi:MAG: glucosylceramidase [Chthonomonadales bacterium]|nr:glucosylceramidase [Chthonomonadales bacterium]